MSKSQEQNKPYVKQYDDKGFLINPIGGSYKNKFPNRRNRRVNYGRPFNNAKSFPTIILKTEVFQFIKYHPRAQKIKSGLNKWGRPSYKTIIH